MATPVGDAGGSLMCADSVRCDPVPALIGSFRALVLAEGVELAWISGAVGRVQAWNVYRSPMREGGYALVNAEPIAMGGGGEFRLVDPVDARGAVYYRLSAIVSDGSEIVVETIEAATTLPSAFAFDLAGPNPFRGSTSLTYSLPARSPVRIEVFNAAGRRLAILANGVQEAGVYRVPFAPRDLAAGLGAGVYQVRITAGRHTKTVQAIAVR
jgi:hypothetical protein